jgi:hypothetical protein
VQLIDSIKCGAVPGMVIFERLQQPYKGNTTFMFYLFTHGKSVGDFDLLRKKTKEPGLKGEISAAQEEIFGFCLLLFLN